MGKINILISFNYHSFFTTFPSINFYPFSSTPFPSKRPRLGLLRPAESPPGNRPVHAAASRRPGSRPPHAVAGESAPARRAAHRSPPWIQISPCSALDSLAASPRSRRWLTSVTLEARKPSSMDLSRPRQTPRPADQCLGSRGSPVLVQCRAQRRATAGDIWRERRRPLDCPMLLWACGAELLVYSSVVLSCEAQWSCWTMYVAPKIGY